MVIYVGQGAGKGDDGEYQVLGLTGVTVSWRYRPLRLWEMAAESLFELDNPAFLALIGQTQLDRPETILPQALDTIRATTSSDKDQLLTALVSLLPTEEIIQMVETLLEESETLLLDTPYLRRMREKGLAEGRAEGMQIGREEGREEGVQIGREEGIREAILEAVVRRFNPLAADYRQLEQRLNRIHQPEMLQEILLALFDVSDVTAVLSLTAQIEGNESL